MTTISRNLLASVHDIPDQAAVYLQRAGQEDVPVTYANLFSGASRYAKALEMHGIQSGEVVILILQHGEDLIFSFFGAVLHRSIPSIMPLLTEKLSPERYNSDLSALINITEPAAIVTYAEFEREIRAALREEDSVRALIVAEECESLKITETGSLQGLMRSTDDIVLLQHSSDTTGLQKGVALSHKAVFNQLDSYERAIALSGDDVIVSWLPLYHDMGLIAGFLMPILKHVPLVLMPPFVWVRAPYRLMKSVSKYQGTLAWLPNFAYNFCAQKIRERDLEGLDLSSWRLIVNCSEPVRWESHQAFCEKFKPYGLRKIALQTSCAMAENVFGVTQLDLSNTPMVEEIDREAFEMGHVAALQPMAGQL